MKILHVTPTFYPATFWGGPIWSTKAICDGISTQPGFEVRVLTTDAASLRVQDRIMPTDLPYPVQYCRRVAGHSIAPGLLMRLPKAIAWADVVHLTATYNFPTLPTLALARLIGRPVVWSPRGALQATTDWADAPRKRTKHLFEHVANALRPKASTLHVTATSEGAQSRQRLGDITTALIPNCVDIPAAAPVRPDHAQLRLLYLGRLHPKKGLDRLIEAMKVLPDHVHLDIYGTGDPDYVDQLIHQTACIPHIRLHGHVEGIEKTQAFARADIFVLPSHSENFGIAIAEALAHGVPVITTTGTPWAALDHHGCGRCIALDHDNLADVIVDLARSDLPLMGARGRAWMQRDFSPDAMVDSFVRLYRDASAGQLAGVLA
jgi:glycosyltransferase involved in cell wall biosynthesis